MKCPNDQSLLVKKIYEGNVEIDECPKCKGMWLDKHELEKIQDTLENDYSDELRKIPDYISRAYKMARSKNEDIRKCPKCDNPMSKKEYAKSSQIIIDICPTCRGVWLDKGELQKLEIFFERSRIKSKDIKNGFLGSLIGLFK